MGARLAPSRKSARSLVSRARERIAEAVGCSPSELVFTSGGTESDNIALFGAARAGFGVKFSNAWGYFLINEVHLWLLVFMAIVLIAEYGVLRPAERIVFRWRDAP